MKKIISILLLICTLTLCLVSCEKNDKDKNENKITEKFIISKLSDSKGELDGTLTITNGTSDNVLAFNYVVTGIYAEKLMDKNFTKNALQKLLSDPGSTTYGELKVCNAFEATMAVVVIFCEGETIVDDNYFIDEILSIICDRSAKTYKNWTITASVDQASDSISIKAINN